jgi:hypothetical protein
MASLLYRLINPPVRWLLRSSLHGLMSQNTVLLEFTGRNSGQDLSTPISYYLVDQTAHCFTSRKFGWWRNLTTGQPVHLIVRGQKWQCRPVVESSDHQLMGKQLEEFLRAVPRDADHAGVSIDKHGNPNLDDIDRVIPDMIYLQFRLENLHE